MMRRWPAFKHDSRVASDALAAQEDRLRRVEAHAARVSRELEGVEPLESPEVRLLHRKIAQAHKRQATFAERRALQLRRRELRKCLTIVRNIDRINAQARNPGWSLP